MKIIRDFYTYSASGNNASGYPLSNLSNIDTNLIWKGLGNSETLLIDLGSVRTVGGIMLNNANFETAKIYLSTSTTFTTFETLTLKPDDLGIKRGFLKLSGSCRYIKLECVGSQIITLGNIIVGAAYDLKVNKWDSDVSENIIPFESDGGSYREKLKGQRRHVFSASFTGSKSELDEIFLNFSRAVIYTDLNDVSDAYIVGIPSNRRKSINTINDMTLSCSFQELI